MAFDLTPLDTAYKAAITTAVTAGVLDTIDEQECLFALACYIAAKTNEETQSGNNVVSYSISGRSFQYDRSDKSNSASAYSRKLFLDRMLGRSSRVTLTNMNATGADV